MEPPIFQCAHRAARVPGKPRSDQRCPSPSRTSGAVPETRPVTSNLAIAATAGSSFSAETTREMWYKRRKKRKSSLGPAARLKKNRYLGRNPDIANPPCGWNKCRFQLWLKLWPSPLKNPVMKNKRRSSTKMPSIRLGVSDDFPTYVLHPVENYLNGWYVCGPRLQWPPLQSQWCSWNMGE